MKRFVVVVLSACLVLGLAVSSLAFTLPSEDVSIEVIDGKESTVIQTFKTSSLSSVNKAWLEDWISSPYRVFAEGSNGGYLFVKFAFPSNYNFSNVRFGFSHRGSRHDLSAGLISGSLNTGSFQSMSFSPDGQGSFVYSSFYETGSLNSGSSQSMGQLVYCSFLDNVVKEYVCNECYLDSSYPLPLYIRDDGGLFGAPEPDPEEPPPPDPPDPPPVTPPDTPEPPPMEPPEIKPPPPMVAPPIVAPPDMPGPVIPPSNSKYVPYDTSALQRFLDYIRKAIGSSTNIGFLIFAIIFGIGLIPKIIKTFSRGK